MSGRDVAAEQSKRVAEGIEEFKEVIKHLEAALKGLELVGDAIDKARGHFSVTTNEIRGQLTVVKDRLNWYIGELDRGRILK